MIQTLKLLLTDRHYSFRFEGKSIWTLSFLACVVFVATGHFLAVTNEVVWLDELLSVIYANGHTVDEIYDHLFHPNRTATSQTILNFLRPKGNVLEVLKNLYQFYPLQQPLYYLILRKWIEWFGMTAPVFVSLSVIMHFTCILFANLFFKLLYEREIQRTIAILFVLVGPLEITYAREARPYILWMNLFFLTNYLYLRALRDKSNSTFCFYALGMIFALYTSLFAIPLSCVHFLLAMYRRMGLVILRKLLVSSVIQVVCFLPWIYLSLKGGFSSLNRQVSWMFEFDADTFLTFWKYNLLSIFYHFPKASDPASLDGYLLLAGAFFLILFLFLIRLRFKLWVQFFIACLLTGTIPLVMWDLIGGGVHSAVIRYQLPTFLTLQSCLAGILGMGLDSSKKIHRWTSGGVFIILFGLNILWNFDFVNLPLHPDEQMEIALNYLSKQKHAELVILNEPVKKTQGMTEGLIASTLALVYNLPEEMNVRWINSDCEVPLQTNKETFLFVPVRGPVSTRNLRLERLPRIKIRLWRLRAQNCNLE